MSLGFMMSTHHSGAGSTRTVGAPNWLWDLYGRTTSTGAEQELEREISDGVTLTIYGETASPTKTQESFTDFAPLYTIDPHIMSLIQFEDGDDVQATDATGRVWVNYANRGKCSIIQPKFGTGHGVTTYQYSMLVSYDCDAFEFGTGDFCFEQQIMCAGANWGYGVGLGNFASPIRFGIYDYDDGGHYKFYIGSSVENTLYSGVISMPSVGEYHHFCVEKKDGVVYLLIDGNVMCGIACTWNISAVTQAYHTGHSAYSV